MVQRVYVEKKEGFDIEAQALKQDICENLGIDILKNVRILQRYDVEGLEKEVFLDVCPSVFAELAVDCYYIDEMPYADQMMFGMAYLPGQYDQRADSAAQCIQLITQKERPLVQSVKIFVFKGISETQLNQIKKYLINPVDSCEVSMDRLSTVEVSLDKPKSVEILDGFIDLKDIDLKNLYTDLSLAMSLEDFKFIQTYFQDTEKRNPTISEIRVIDTYWSDHCRHTTFLTKINSVEIENIQEQEMMQCAIKQAFELYKNTRDEVYGSDTKRVITLMDIATIGAKKLKKDGTVTNIDESEEINACSIRVDVTVQGKKYPYLVMFKNETHNHPTEIEPFGGAATCLGGAIRDPLSGRSYVYQAMRITGSADPREETTETLAGKLPQRTITKGATAGYSSYGNQIGLATGLVREIYHQGYQAKHMEIGAVIGAAPESHVRREAPTVDDVILLLGGRTGRDGIGGATGSSKAHTEESVETCGAQVQKGNPITERKLQRLYKNPEFTSKVKRCNDFGAGGICVAVGELARSLVIDLDAVPKKYEGLDGTELAISESQERMAVVVDSKDIARIMELAEGENLECTPVALVTEDERLVMRWRGNDIVNISREFLDTNGIQQNADVEITLPDFNHSPFKKKTKFSLENAKACLGDLNYCSQRGMGEWFDGTIGAGSVLMPFGGQYQCTQAQTMAALIPVLEGVSETATIMSYGFDPYISEWSPLHGASYAVLDSLARIVASGGSYKEARLTFQEYYERLEEVPTRWGKPFAALLGALQAQIAMGTPAIGGKDSMSGTFGEMRVPPTLVSFAVAPTEAKNIISNEFKKAGNAIVLFPSQMDQVDLPDYESVNRQFQRVEALCQTGVVFSVSAVSNLLATIANNCFGNRIGFCQESSQVLDYFVPMYGSLIVEIDQNMTIPEGAILIGRTIAEAEIVVDNIQLPLETCQQCWEEPLENIFPTHVKSDIKQICPVVAYEERSIMVPTMLTKQPMVVIPVLPGTNCEYDTAKALTRAGALASVCVINNSNQGQIERSVDLLAKQISNAQMLILPGGFSGGDEPDGSAKFFTALLKAPKITEAVHSLLNERDGLILGICNGFQALIKTGLVPDGYIHEMSDNSPTLTYNLIGRHISRFAWTRVASVKSPWMRFCDVGDVYRVAMSHGEGRFVASMEDIERLIDGGQIVTQYSDEEGNPTMDSEYNINGSFAAVEGICSPDGRVFGKMGHVERIGPNLYRNIPGEMDMRIFESGVAYFQNK